MSTASCNHLDAVEVVEPQAEIVGCEECLSTGQTWVALRMCHTCGHVGCCDSSPAHHATEHFKATGHPIMRSVMPGESWSWCYVDETWVQVAPG